MATTTAPETITNPVPAADAGTLSERADSLAYLNACLREAIESGEVEEGEIPAWLDELFVGAEADLRTKMERTGLAALHKEQEADTVDVEIKRLQARKKALQNAAEHIRRYAHLCLEIAGETKVQTPLVTVALQQNPPSVRGDLPPEQLDALYAEASPLVRFIPASYALDKKAVLDAFKRGEPIPAGLAVERSTSLRIR